VYISVHLIRHGLIQWFSTFLSRDPLVAFSRTSWPTIADNRKIYSQSPFRYKYEQTKCAVGDITSHAKSAKHSRLPLSCVLSNAHTFALAQMPRCVWSPFLEEIFWLLARNSPLAFFKEVKTSDFVSFALVISSNESQSKAQFNLQNLGEIRLITVLDTQNLFPQMKTSRKDHIWLHYIFIPSRKCTAIRGVTRLDGARDEKQLWHPHIRTWALSGANVLYWRKYLWHFWDFSATRQSFGPHIVIRRPGNCVPLDALLTAWQSKDICCQLVITFMLCCCL